MSPASPTHWWYLKDDMLKNDMCISGLVLFKHKLLLNAIKCKKMKISECSSSGLRYLMQKPSYLQWLGLHHDIAMVSYRRKYIRYGMPFYLVCQTFANSFGAQPRNFMLLTFCILKLSEQHPQHTMDTRYVMMPYKIARFMGPTWGPPRSCRPQMGPMLAPCTLLSGIPFSIIMAGTQHWINFEVTKDASYLTLKGDLWDNFSELFGERWSRNTKSTL